jgi:cell wall-associated NlpC family hydrolase
MAALSIQEIYNAARTAGFSPEQAVTWTGIAFAESGGKPGALNPKGEYSMGLWQINVNADPARKTEWGDLNDPVNNARAAYAISNHGRNLWPWTTTHHLHKGTRSDYRHYLPQIEKEIGVKGDWSGVINYKSHLPDPPAGHHARSYDQIDRGNDLGATDAADNAGGLTTAADKDTDHDGLTDAFEDLAGLNKTRKDSDGDGLLDGYEALVSHTDPMSKDTDHDGVSDPDELKAGTDPGHLAGVAGVVGTGIFTEKASDAKDTDHDGLSDRTEGLVGTNAKAADTDADGLPDGMEAALGTDPTVADSDHDGVTDGLEVKNHSNPLGNTGIGPAEMSTTPWTLEGAAAQVAKDHAAAPAGQSTAEPTGHGSGSKSALGVFLKVAKAQRGDTYDYSYTPAASDPNPSRFDCSSLTQWAAGKAGVGLKRTAEQQYTWAKNHHNDIDVEQALKTPGALLFYFNGDPSHALPAGSAHVAISLGDGRTIEARGSDYGVGIFSATNRFHKFNRAAVIPGISDAAGLQAYDEAHRTATTVALAETGDATATSAHGDQSAAAATATYGIESGKKMGEPDHFRGAGKVDKDSDHDGLTDAFEALAGTNANDRDSDDDGLTDGYEAMTSHTDPLSAGPGRIPGIGGVVGSGRFAENFRHIKDTDGDGLSDRTERLLHLNPRKADTDGDRLPDGMELALGTDAKAIDSDHDGVSDWLEVQYHTDPLSAGSSLGAGFSGGADSGLTGGGVESIADAVGDSATSAPGDGEFADLG